MTIRISKNLIFSYEPANRVHPKGISAKRKKTIIDNLCPLMPASRKAFWHELPEVQVEEPTINEDDAYQD